MKQEIPDKNLFMMCNELNLSALSELPLGYYVRTCQKSELDLWKRIHFDDPEEAKENSGMMTSFFHAVYGSKEDLFFQKCLFACDKNDTPVGTCFAWQSYEKIMTIHWFKVVKSYEGFGIGRALLSIVMKAIDRNDYPVYLHTQPSSYRAIKLYRDFGFSLLSDPVIGYRQNHLADCLPILKDYMPPMDFVKLRVTKAPEDFLLAVKSSEISQF